MRLAETREHRGDHAAQLADSFRCFGLRPVLSPGRFPVDAVEGFVEVSVANDPPRGVERLQPEGYLGRQRRDTQGRRETTCDQAAAPHFLRALISAGSSNTEGSTVSNSTEVNVMM